MKKEVREWSTKEMEEIVKKGSSIYNGRGSTSYK